MRTAAGISAAQGLQRKKFVRATGTQGSQKSQLRNTYVLSLVDNDKVEWRPRIALEVRCESIEHPGIRDYQVA
jgi:hypothetical protein